MLIKGNKGRKSNRLSLKAGFEINEIPEVILDGTYIMEETIAKWLGITLKNGKYSNQELELIKKRIGLILKRLGVPADETCILSDFDRKNSYFNCYFSNAGDYVSMTLDNNGDCPQLCVEYENVTKKYDYHEPTYNRAMRLHLSEYTIRNEENGSVCRRYLSSYGSYFTISNGDYSLCIDLNKPEGSIYGGARFRLKNERELEHYLLSLSFPIAIDEVYKKICEMSLDEIELYPKVSLEVSRKVNDNKSVTTDKVVTEYGQMANFTMTKNGRTVSVDRNGKWEYQSSHINAIKDGTISMSFNVKGSSREEIPSIISPLEELDRISEEVNRVEGITKTLF